VKRAEGALLENGFVSKGTTNDEVLPKTTEDNLAATGFVDEAIVDNGIAAVLGNGSIVACISDGTTAYGDQVVTGNTRDGVQNIAQYNPANNADVHIVGMILDGGTNGQRVHVLLNRYTYVHGE
jgi:N-acyl-D-aspartate/D-glutamate deacylase